MQALADWLAQVEAESAPAGLRAAVAPAEPVPLPESVWFDVFGFASLADVLRGACASTLLFRASAHGSLPARSEVRISDLALGDTTCAGLVGVCPNLQVLETRIAWFRGGKALGHALGTTMLRRLRLEMTASGWELTKYWDCVHGIVAALGSGSCKSLEALGLCLEPGPGDDLLLQLCGHNEQSPMPLLRELSLWNWRHVRHKRTVARVLRTFRTLQVCAMPGCIGARHLAWRVGDFPLRLNALTGDLLPPLRVECSLCGAPLYDRLDKFLVGPPTQNHIGFEIYTHQPPDRDSVTPVHSLATRLNCKNNCHSAFGLFLVAGHGDFVDTRGLPWALACGGHLARIKVSDRDMHLAHPRIDFQQAGDGVGDWLSRLLF